MAFPPPWTAPTNLKEVDDIVPWLGGRLKLTLKNGEEVEVSRRQTVKLEEMYSL